MQKSDFISLFWAAYTSTFTFENITSSFAATGVHLLNPDVVLQRFKISTPQRDTDTEVREYGDGNTWRQLSKLYDAAVPDKSKVEAKELKQALHSLQVRNALLHYENEELRSEINAKKQKKKHNSVLDLQQHQEYQSLAVVRSPRSVQEARAREHAKRQEAKAEKLRKQEQKEIKAAATAYKKRLQQKQKKPDSWHGRYEQRSGRRRLRNSRLPGFKNNKNALLQHQKNLKIGGIKAKEKLHQVKYQKQLSVAVLRMIRVVVRLHRSHPSPPPKPPRAAAKSIFRVNISRQPSNILWFYYSTKNLMILAFVWGLKASFFGGHAFWWGGSLTDHAHALTMPDT